MLLYKRGSLYLVDQSVVRLREIMSAAHNKCGINASQQPSSLLPAIAPNFLWVSSPFPVPSPFPLPQSGAYDPGLSQSAHGILLASDWFGESCDPS